MNTKEKLKIIDQQIFDTNFALAKKKIEKLQSEIRRDDYRLRGNFGAALVTDNLIDMIHTNIRLLQKKLDELHNQRYQALMETNIRGTRNPSHRFIHV